MTADVYEASDGWRRAGQSDELLLVVEVARRRCALRAQDVVEVHPLVLVSPLPHAPAIIEGLIDAHGELMPVIDLGWRFDGQRLSSELSHRLVIVDTARRRLALHVERSLDLVSVDMDQVRPSDLTDAPYADGIASLPDGLVVIYDIEAFLSAPESVELDDAMAASKGRTA